MAKKNDTLSVALTADAALIAACSRYRRIWSAYEAMVSRHSNTYGVHLPEIADREQGAIADRIADAMRDVRDTPAKTLEGIQAKATVVRFSEGWMIEGEPDNLLYSLLRDLNAEIPA